MKKLLVVILLLSCFAGRTQTHNCMQHANTTGFPDEILYEAKELYNWHDVENAFAKRVYLNTSQTSAFFSFAFSKGNFSMHEFLELVQKGSITKENALQYWLEKLPQFEKLYNERYIYSNYQNAKQGHNTVSTGGANCNNLDFGNGTNAGWTGAWNNVGGPPGQGFYGSPVVNGLNSSGGYNATAWVHELCNGGFDANVPVSTVPPGHSYAVRLGNDSAYRVMQATGTNSNLPYNSQVLSNKFLVTQANQAITYWFAVVLCQYNPNNHGATIQPYFKIRLYDANGNEITCAHYDVDALTATSIGGFQTVSTTVYNSNTGVFDPYDFFYKDWSPVMIPLTNYIGQNVTLTFETSDCAGGGHPGYAYVAADCAPMPGITFTPFTCGMTSTVLTAPPGLGTYSWSGPGIVGSHSNQTVTVNTGGTYTVTMTTIGNSGLTCTMKLDTFLVSVPAPPVATFTTAMVCAGNPTVFTNVTPGVYNHIMWDFGDGTKDSVNTAPTHTYANPGTYTVSLLLDNGCIDTYTAVVTVNPNASASFNAAPVCQGSPTVFNNTSTGGTSYNWNFGDGSPLSNVQSPTHTYATAGIFAVTLTVTSSGNCKSISTNSITVNVIPVPAFSSPVSCLGSPTNFTNATTPTASVTYTWDFGDGTPTSSVQNPSHTYTSLGTYTVSLQVVTTAGCSASVNNVLTVNPIPGMVLVTPAPYCWGDAVPQPSYTVNPNNASVIYSWSNTNSQIGLGLSGGGIPPAFTAGLNNTIANISGVITVVPSLNGCPGPPATFTITVKPTPIVNHASVDLCPNTISNALTFTASPAGSSIVWINTTPGVNIGMTTNNGTTTLPSFTTIDPGTSLMTDNISLQAVFNGCTGPLSTFYISVNPNPVASFTNSVACDGAGTNFYDASTVGSGVISQWNWDMNNDGIYSDATVQNPSYVLSPVGYHTVNLIVTSNAGCKDSVTELVYVNPRPMVVFKGDTLSGCNPLKPHFTDSCYVVAPDHIVTWIWNFGNGNTETDTSSVMATTTYTNNTHTSNASFSVSLTVITNVGCASKLTKNNYITVYPIPLALFWWDPSDADILEPNIHFHDQSLGASGPNAYNWNFGDVFNTANNTSTETNPIHEYSDQQPYTYYAMQIVENIYGCKDSVIEPVIIKPAVTFYAPSAFTPNFNGLNDGFKGTGVGIDNSTYNMWIYDRWGMELFHSTDLEQSWDGRVKGKGEISQEDTYVWKVYFKDIVGKEHYYKGVVNLLK